MKQCKEKGIIINSKECYECNRRNYKTGRTCETLLKKLMLAIPSPIAPIIKIKLPTTKELEEMFI